MDKEKITFGDFVDDFKISSYLRQQFLLIEKESDAIFGKKARQLNLSKYK
jgi:hypothetical protein